MADLNPSPNHETIYAEVVRLREDFTRMAQNQIDLAEKGQDYRLLLATYGETLKTHSEAIEKMLGTLNTIERRQLVLETQKDMAASIMGNRLFLGFITFVGGLGAATLGTFLN